MSDVPGLFQKGFRQGVLFRCGDGSLCDAIKDGRAVSTNRGKQASGDSRLILILSQDCDISNDSPGTEKNIELITIKKKGNPSELVQYVQNYRKLQFQYNGEYWECDVELISMVPKDAFNDGDISIVGSLDSVTLESVIDWRIGRYKRLPFPHNFNQDFIHGYLKSTDNGLGLYLEEKRDQIDHLHVFVDPMDNDDADEYIVSMTALVGQHVEESEAQEISDVLKGHAQALHELPNRLKMMQITDERVPEEFDVPLEFVMKPSDMTLSDAGISRRITLDYLCYIDREDE
jgi:hypothetical protein